MPGVQDPIWWPATQTGCARGSGERGRGEGGGCRADACVCRMTLVRCIVRAVTPPSPPTWSSAGRARGSPRFLPCSSCTFSNHTCRFIRLLQRAPTRSHRHHHRLDSISVILDSLLQRFFAQVLFDRNNGLRAIGFHDEYFSLCLKNKWPHAASLKSLKR